jgi:hypothetical protein
MISSSGIQGNEAGTLAMTEQFDFRLESDGSIERSRDGDHEQVLFAALAPKALVKRFVHIESIRRVSYPA